MTFARRLGFLVLPLVAIGERADPPVARSAPSEEVERMPHRSPVREHVTGASFPDGVVALTWDDGPDAHTLDLARWLHAHRVSATFFVVEDWIGGVSEEPGEGRDRFATGHRHLPILAELVRLGHRLGNHTANHVLLGDAPLGLVVDQLGRGQSAIDPHLSNELRMFRAPGGYWSDDASSAIDARAFATTIGPVRWDIDEKDWEAARFARSPAPTVAARYVATIERVKKGIVLLHDRVGAVGSTYALDLARVLVPALEQRGFVFAAPVLAFGRFAPRDVSFDASSPLVVRDVDGDGRADLCGRLDGSFGCARSIATTRDGAPFTSFGPFETGLGAPDGELLPMGAERRGDLNGDGRDDVCTHTPDGVACSLSNGRELKSPTLWLDARVRSFELGDVNGDGRADLCAIAVDGRAHCALAP